MIACRLMFPNCTVYVCLLSSGTGPASSNSTRALFLRTKHVWSCPEQGQDYCVIDARSTSSQCQRGELLTRLKTSLRFGENKTETSCASTCAKRSSSGSHVSLQFPAAAKGSSPGFLWEQYRLSLAADFTDQLRSMKNFWPSGWQSQRSESGTVLCSGPQRLWARLRK